MYEKCLECKKLGNPCDGPNFMAMSTEDLIHWCNERKKQLPGLTYDRIVEQTGLSKGTVSGFFKGTHADYRIETIRPILKLLVGGEWEDSPCGDPTAEERAHYEDRIRELEAGIAWRDDKINHLMNSNHSMETLIANTNKRHEDANAHHEEQLQFLRREIKRKNKFMTAMTVVAILALLYIIVTLIIDRMNGDVGFFWLEGLLRPGSKVWNNWRT